MPRQWWDTWLQIAGKQDSSNLAGRRQWLTNHASLAKRVWNHTTFFTSFARTGPLFLFTPPFLPSLLRNCLTLSFHKAGGVGRG